MEKDQSKKSSWWEILLWIGLSVFAAIWTFKSCSNPREEEVLSSFNNSSLVKFNPDDYAHLYALVDSTYLPYSIEVGFYDTDQNVLIPEMLDEMYAKAIDILIEKTPAGSREDQTAQYYGIFRQNLQTAGALIQDRVERQAFIYKYYINLPYEEKMQRLLTMVSQIHTEVGGKALSRIFEILPEQDLSYFFQRNGYMCGRHCRGTSVYPEKIAHYPEEVLKTLIRKYDNKYNWAELTFTASGTIRNGLEKALKLKQESGSSE